MAAVFLADSAGVKSVAALPCRTPSGSVTTTQSAVRTTAVPLAIWAVTCLRVGGPTFWRWGGRERRPLGIAATEGAGGAARARMSRAGGGERACAHRDAGGAGGDVGDAVAEAQVRQRGQHARIGALHAAGHDRVGAHNGGALVEPRGAELARAGGVLLHDVRVGLPVKACGILRAQFLGGLVRGERVAERRRRRRLVVAPPLCKVVAFAVVVELPEQRLPAVHVRNAGLRGERRGAGGRGLVGRGGCGADGAMPLCRRGARAMRQLKADVRCGELLMDAADGCSSWAPAAAAAAGSCGGAALTCVALA